MKVLVWCRPAAGVDAATAFGPHLDDEREALRELRDRGVLAEAYSPGEPGAVLVLNAPDAAAAQVFAAALPLAAAGLIITDVVPLHPMPL